MSTKSTFNRKSEILVEETTVTNRSAKGRRLGELRREDCRRKPARRRKQKDIFKQV